MFIRIVMTIFRFLRCLSILLVYKNVKKFGIHYIEFIIFDGRAEFIIFLAKLIIYITEFINYLGEHIFYLAKLIDFELEFT